MERNGDYGLTQISGLVGLFVGLGQVLIGDGSRFTHAFLIVDAELGLAVEARPSGARVVHYRTQYGDREKVYSHLELTDQQRAHIVAAAESMVGRKYNWLDYLALTLAHWGVRPGWVVRRIETTTRLICSQLVDEAYRQAGVHLFDDGRLPQDVTPGDLTYVGSVY